MAFVHEIEEAAAPADVEPLYARARELNGYVSNFTRVWAHRPAVLRAWEGLNGAIKESMDLRRYELATLAAARRLRSSYCMLAHGSVVLKHELLEPQALRAVAEDPRTAGLDEQDTAVMEFADKLAADATAVTQADVDRLRAAGLADDEIVSVAAAAAARCFFSKVLDALGIQPDAAYASLEPSLREALVVGRPIADG